MTYFNHSLSPQKHSIEKSLSNLGWFSFFINCALSLHVSFERTASLLFNLGLKVDKNQIWIFIVKVKHEPKYYFLMLEHQQILLSNVYFVHVKHEPWWCKFWSVRRPYIARSINESLSSWWDVYFYCVEYASSYIVSCFFFRIVQRPSNAFVYTYISLWIEMNRKKTFLWLFIFFC